MRPGTENLRLRSLVCALALAFTLSSAIAWAGNGDPVVGHPNYEERAMLAVTNACRQGPQAWRDTYLPSYPEILQPQNYPAQPPLCWCLVLNQAARAHTYDMATNGCFQHSSCDGTPWNVRISSYYTESALFLENIGAMHTTPFAMVNAWIADGGAPDLDADGHRRNIMTSYIHEMGNGYTYSPGSTYTRYWTQNFGGGAADFTTPLAWGSHVLTGDGNVTFLANYYSTADQSPLEALLILDGQSYSMIPTFGTPARGTYRTMVAIGTGCRTYYFRFRDHAGTTWLHPEAGVLRTTREGGCTEEYLAGSVGVPPAGAAIPAVRVSPNPAVSAATIEFTVPRAGEATARVFDLGGRLLREARLGNMVGAASWTWDLRDGRGRHPGAGVYFIVVDAGAWSASRRLVVLDAPR